MSSLKLVDQMFGEGFDVTVVCGEVIYHLNADLLAAKSRFFATALDIAMVEKQMGRITVKEVKPETFKKVVKFFHDNKLEDDEEEGMDLGEMLEAADRFDMDGLKSTISERVKDNINTSNLMTISKLAETFNVKRLRGVCASFIMNNSVVLTTEVAEHPELVLALLVEKDKEMGFLQEELAGIRKELNDAQNVTWDSDNFTEYDYDYENYYHSEELTSSEEEEEDGDGEGGLKVEGLVQVSVEEKAGKSCKVPGENTDQDEEELDSVEEAVKKLRSRGFEVEIVIEKEEAGHI